MIQYGVAALVKDMPFTADYALSWIIRMALNPSNLPCWTTKLTRDLGDALTECARELFLVVG